MAYLFRLFVAPFGYRFPDIRINNPGDQLLARMDSGMHFFQQVANSIYIFCISDAASEFPFPGKRRMHKKPSNVSRSLVFVRCGNYV